MKRFGTEYVNSCLNCLYYMAFLEKNQFVCTRSIKDHLGPFIKSKRANTQLLVIVYGFIKFCIIEPVRNTKSKYYVIRCLKASIDIFSVPVRVITDRRSALTSRSFQKCCSNFDIKHIIYKYKAYNERGRLCERFNRIILNSLAAQNGRYEDYDWNLQVKAVQRGLNNMIHQFMGHSPSEVFLGRKPRGATNSILLNKIQGKMERGSVTEVWDVVKQRADRDQFEQKHRFNSRRVKPPI